MGIAAPSELSDFGGPTELQDTFLPSQLRYQSYPESARVNSEYRWNGNVTVDWTAHLARTSTYLFDGESVTTTIKLRHSPAPKWEFGLDLPYTARVDGTLDEFIEFVETTLNAKVPDRFELPRDTYQAFITGDTGPDLILKKTYGMSDMTLRAKYQFLDQAHGGFNASLVGVLSLPTGADTFGGQGVSPGLGLNIERPFKYFNLFLGGAGNYYTDNKEQGFEFNDWRGMAYAGTEWKPLRWLSFIGMYQIYTPFASRHHPLDEIAHYYSVTGRFWFGKNTFFETGVVENLGLIENRNSSDVTFKFALTVRF